MGFVLCGLVYDGERTFQNVLSAMTEEEAIKLFTSREIYAFPRFLLHHLSQFQIPDFPEIGVPPKIHKTLPKTS